MSDKVAEITGFMGRDQTAEWVSQLWDRFNIQRTEKMMAWDELKKYLFATDTSSTSNSTLPWKNSTTLPKLTQIRDNLHSNYMSALFPNDKWLTWQAYSKDSAKKQKAKIIKAYIENKARMSGFRTTVSKMLYDYIDYGNVFSTCTFERRYNTAKDGSKSTQYVGPKAIRISPEDIVFNPTAASFEESFKIIRSVKTIGELKKLAMTEPEHLFWAQALERRDMIRKMIGTGYSKEDFNKASQYSVDGFGNLYEYYMSDYMEILEFYGDYHNQDTGELKVNRMITVVDRSVMVRDEPIATDSGAAPIWHCGWRFRPDNLWAMGPLDNLVGMQYRIDHLENLKADAMDLMVHPPLKIVGEVEEFVWEPGAEIHIDEAGDVAPVHTELNAIIVADNQIADLEMKMELYAGAPREAMGVRSPGEKTALEIQTLDNAAGRIFQEKSVNIEINVIEPTLNGMLESARRNMTGSDVIVATDNDVGAKEFLTITKDDISANGIIRPIGARHFAQQATELQNLIGIANSPLWAMIAPHTSGKNLTKFVEDLTAIDAYHIFRPNVAIEEAQETQGLMNQVSEDLEVQATGPTESQTLPPEEMMN